MRNITCSIADTRKRVFAEVAKMAYDEDYSRMEKLPYEIMPGEKATVRESIFLERAIVGERIRLAMGLPLRSVSEHNLLSDGVEESAIAEKYYDPPLINIIKYACNACPPTHYEVSNMCQGCLAHHCYHACPKNAISFVKGKAVIDLGWRAYWGAPYWAPLPELSEGVSVAITSATVREGKTTPPAAYTEDTLLAAMERAGAKDAPSDAEHRGLGTPATRAATIEKLVKGGFAERVKGKLVPTDTGASLVTVLPEALRSPLLTAEWENRLKQIERGELDAGSFLAEIEGMVSGLVAEYKPVAEASVLFPTGRTVVGKCPRCGGVVSEAKNGYFCESLDCKFGLWRDNKYLAAKRISLTRSLATELLENGRAHLDEIYSPRMDKYYPGDLILHDDGEHARYFLSFGGGKK